MSSVVKRADRRHFMNVGTADVPVWELMGEGFTSFCEVKNPVIYSRRYIHENASRTDVTGYSPEVEYALDVYSDNPVIDKIRYITDKEETGENARVEVMTVDYFDAGSDGRFRAAKRFFYVIPDECGEGTDALIYTGTLRALGDAEFGLFDASLCCFIPEQA